MDDSRLSKLGNCSHQASCSNCQNLSRCGPDMAKGAGHLADIYLFERTKSPVCASVTFTYQGNLIERDRCRATNLIWSFWVYKLGRSVTKTAEPVLYYLENPDSIRLVVFSLVERCSSSFSITFERGQPHVSTAVLLAVIQMVNTNKSLMWQAT